MSFVSICFRKTDYLGFITEIKRRISQTVFNFLFASQWGLMAETTNKNGKKLKPFKNYLQN